MALGRLVRCFEFRWPLLSILDRCWPREHFRFQRSLNEASVRELLHAVYALLLAVGSLRTLISGLIACSDASMEGADSALRLALLWKVRICWREAAGPCCLLV